MGADLQVAKHMATQHSQIIVDDNLQPIVADEVPGITGDVLSKADGDLPLTVGVASSPASQGNTLAHATSVAMDKEPASHFKRTKEREAEKVYGKHTVGERYAKSTTENETVQTQANLLKQAGVSKTYDNGITPEVALTFAARMAPDKVIDVGDPALTIHGFGGQPTACLKFVTQTSEMIIPAKALPPYTPTAAGQAGYGISNAIALMFLPCGSSLANTEDASHGGFVWWSPLYDQYVSVSPSSGVYDWEPVTGGEQMIVSPINVVTVSDVNTIGVNIGDGLWQALPVTTNGGIFNILAVGQISQRTVAGFIRVTYPYLQNQATTCEAVTSDLGLSGIFNYLASGELSGQTVRFSQVKGTGRNQANFYSNPAEPGALIRYVGNAGPVETMGPLPTSAGAFITESAITSIGQEATTTQTRKMARVMQHLLSGQRPGSVDLSEVESIVTPGSKVVTRHTMPSDLWLRQESKITGLSVDALRARLTKNNTIKQPALVEIDMSGVPDGNAPPVSSAFTGPVNFALADDTMSLMVLATAVSNSPLTFLVEAAAQIEFEQSSSVALPVSEPLATDFMPATQYASLAGPFLSGPHSFWSDVGDFFSDVGSGIVDTVKAVAPLIEVAGALL